MYEMDFDTEMKDGDEAFEDKALRSLQKKSYLYLVDRAQVWQWIKRKGFEFFNPNANRTCGCGGVSLFDV